MNRKQILITLIGTDGSGKTSISNALDILLEKSNLTSKVIWCGAESYLMKPVRLFLGFFSTWSTNRNYKNNSYSNEIEAKNRLSTRLSSFTFIYVQLILLDYSFQYHWKMWLHRNTNVLILDRYFFDVAVNIAITLAWDETKLIQFIQKYSCRYTLPDCLFFIYVPPETSMERKDDIPDISYVQLRLKYYQAIADYYNFTILSGENNISSNAENIFEIIISKFETRYIHYVHSNNEDIGGADFCLYRMAEAVNNTANYRSAISLRLRTSITKQYENSGIPVFIGDYCRPQLSRGILQLLILPLKSAYSIWYFWRLFRTQKPDIVHVNDLYDFLPALAAKLANIPVVYHVRMIRTNRREIRIFSWLLLHLSNISISVSKAVRDTYFDTVKELPTHHTAEIVYDWPNPKLVSPLESPNRPIEFLPYDTIVVMIGRIEWWKGQHVFLNALRELKHRPANVGLFLIGGVVKGESKEKYAKEVFSEADKLGVVYLGQREDVDTLLLHADISVHASVTPDPFPGVVLESLLSQSATIGADSGGVSEMIRDKRDGLKYQPGNSEQLSECIAKLLDDEMLRIRYSRSGRQRILEMTDKAEIMRQTICIYESCE